MMVFDTIRGFVHILNLSEVPGYTFFDPTPRLMGVAGESAIQEETVAAVHPTHRNTAGPVEFLSESSPHGVE